MKTQSYNEEFKKMAVQKLLSLNSLGLSGTARQIGIPYTTLFNWKKKYANSFVMKKTKNKALAINWTAEEKLEAVNKTYAMTENELGEYLRSNGLNSCDLDAFKTEFLSSLPSRGRPKLDPEIIDLRNSVKDLTKNLNKKDKALAEMSARVILLKKSHLIWGDREDDE
jgi:transposase